MKHIGATEFEIPDDETVSNPALLIALAGKRCYMSFQVGLNSNVSKIRSDYVEYFDNILSSGHGSVLEHSVFNFAIEGISRVFTAEMNRHRAGWAISEGSLRFIRFGECIPYWLPDSIKGPDVFDVEDEWGEDGAMGQAHDLVMAAEAHSNTPQRDSLPLGESVREKLSKILSKVAASQHLDARKNLSRAVFSLAFAGQEDHYRVLEQIWAAELAPESKFAGKKQITSMMRRIVGLGVATGGVWSGNVRALRHVFTMRASAQAEEEMLHVFSRVAKKMAEDEPLLFGDFTETPEGFWVPKYVKV